MVNARGIESTELAAKLRGGPVFDVLDHLPDTYGVEVLRPRLKHGASTSVMMPTGPHPLQISLVDLDFIVDYPDRWEELRKCTTTIVDVHFPLGSILNIQAIQPGRNVKTRDRAADTEAQVRWDDPERQARAARILSEADAVVSPRKEWATLLEYWSEQSRPWPREMVADFTGPGHYGEVAIPVKVHVLTDVVSAGTGGRFTSQLASITNRAMKRRYRPLIPWWKRLHQPVLSFLSWRGQAAVGKLMTSDLIQADVDFTYAQVSE